MSDAEALTKNKYIRRVSVLFLKPDMFITRLDRPWIDTPFWLQGFILKTDEELDALQRYCRSVYIDIRRGIEAEYYMEEDLELPSNKSIEKQIKKKKHLIRYLNRIPLRTELPVARNILEETTEQFASFLEELQEGEPFSIDPIYQLIDPMLQSVLRNSDALILLSRLRVGLNHFAGLSVDCCINALVFGRFMGLKGTDLKNLAAGALLFDIGKLKIPNEVLNKSSTLSNSEFALTYTHVEHGVNYLKKDKGIHEDIVNMTLTHHERCDGSGYPNGLNAERIPVFGKIGGIIDCYNTMCTPRPYKEESTPHHALQEIYSLRKEQFQPELVEKFLHCMGIYPNGSLIEFKSGVVGVVLTQNYSQRLKPQVLLVLDEHKKPYTELTVVNLATADIKSNANPLVIHRALKNGADGVNLHTIYSKLDSVLEHFNIELALYNPKISLINRLLVFIDDLMSKLKS